MEANEKSLNFPEASNNLDGQLKLTDELEFLKPFPHPEHLLHITERLIDRISLKE